MPKPKILGIDKAKRTFPLIELIGPVDIGKRYIAKLVASKLLGYQVGFPVLDQNSITGSAILAASTSSEGSMETLPHWWAHIYAAHLLEYGDYLKRLLKERPVIVTNYILSYRYWNSATGAKSISERTEGIFPDLPIPQKGYSIIGAKSEDFPGNLQFPISETFKIRLRVGMHRALDGRIVKVHTNPEDSLHTYVNQTAKSITDDICQHFKLKQNPFAMYNPKLELVC